jgi:thiamine pyrophosphate-dependent acetolactate synthase large subunit-like protein
MHDRITRSEPIARNSIVIASAELHFTFTLGEADMTRNVADFFWMRLHEWGVRCVFGYPGDGINGLLGGLQRLGEDKIRFIQVRHEEMAAFMASAYAKFTGQLGVCIATSGPGASHLITGLHDARLDHMPVLAIAGQQARTAVGGHYQQEVDVVSMFKDAVGAFVHQASMPAQVRHLVDRAVRIAVGERRVTALVMPNDLQEAAYAPPPRKHGTVHSGVGYTSPKVVPYEADLRRAADVLNSGKRVAMLVGAGALQATDEVIAVAERLGAGVAKALLGKGAVPDDLPWVTGSDRAAWHQAELGNDGRLRHAVDDRLRLPLFGVPAGGRQRARRADRYRSGHAEHPLSDGSQSRRRQRGDLACPAAAVGAEAGRLLAAAD